MRSTEDLLQFPARNRAPIFLHTFLRDMYEFCQLDVGALQGKVRLKAKILPPSESGPLAEHWSRSKSLRNIVPGKKYWIATDSLDSFVNFSVNQGQRDALQENHRRELTNLCGPVLERFDYL